MKLYKNLIKSVYFLVVIGLLVSCNKKTKTASKEVPAEIIVAKTDSNSEKQSSKTIKDCDDFLDTYETWTNDIITIMAKHKDDPVTMAMSPEYVNTMTEGMSFIQDWNTIALSCSTNDSYENRMKEIQQKMQDKQKELGF